MTIQQKDNLHKVLKKERMKLTDFYINHYKKPRKKHHQNKEKSKYPYLIIQAPLLKISFKPVSLFPYHAYQTFDLNVSSKNIYSLKFV
jgi:hypothetical protein